MPKIVINPEVSRNSVLSEAEQERLKFDIESTDAVEDHLIDIELEKLQKEVEEQHGDLFELENE